MGSFIKYLHCEKWGGGTIKAYENVQGEEVEGKRAYAIKNC